MSDSPSVASRPTESELDLELAELVNWQRFATHLPDLTAADIEQIKLDNNSNVAQQKLGLYRKWLQTSTKASWEYVITALEKAKENILADVVKKKFNTASSSSSLLQTFSNATEAQFRYSQGVCIPSEEIVVEELKKLHRSFTSLARDIRCKLDELVKSGTSSLHNIAAFIQEARVCGIKGLTGVSTIDELFDAILPYNDYLDCELLEMIVEEYLYNDDIIEVKAHIDKVKLFKCTTPIKVLKNKLQQYTSIPSISDMHLIVTIKLQADWGRVALESIEKLVQNLLQYQHKVRILKIEAGSISVMLLLPKEKYQHFIVSSSQKLQFMRSTGIFRLQIGTITIFEVSENKNFTFKSAFLESSQCGDDEAVQFLLNWGVNVNYSNSEGQTALLLASKSGQEKVVKTLISAGAIINHHDNNGHTALIFSKTSKIFLLLLQPNADINVNVDESSTPLMMACDLGYLTAVETLLRLNNNPDVQNKLGWSALMFASRNGHLQVVELLLQENADPNVCTNAGCTALIFASHIGYHHVVELLLHKGANPNIQRNNGLTALMVASHKGHRQVVELLLKYGANPDIHSGKGETALMVASKNGHSNVVKILLQYKANPDFEIHNHLDSFTIATIEGNTDVVNTFLNYTEVRFESLSMVWYYACQLGHTEIISLLSSRIDIVSDQTDLIYFLC